MLERLTQETVEMRMLRQALVFTYKVTFELVSGLYKELFIMSNSSISTQSHAYKLFQCYSRINCRKHVFVERIINSGLLIMTLLRAHSYF